MVTDNGEKSSLIIGDAESNQIWDPLIKLFSHHIGRNTKYSFDMDVQG